MSPWPLTVPANSHFSLSNIPFGVVSRRQDGAMRVCATRVGDHIVDLSVLEAEGLLGEAFGDDTSSQRVFAQVRPAISLALSACLRELTKPHYSPP